MKLIRVVLAGFLVFAVSATALEKHDRDRDDDSKHGHGRGHHDDWDRHDHHREHDEHFVRYEEHEGHHHRRIPEDHFRAHFGREHWFRIGHPVVVAGHPRFEYDGYWFVVGRPLPPGWRYTDTVYVDYVDDGYYMCSPAHPGIRVSIDIL
jgi:Ni/Co efflux regulator RcnB